MRREMLDPIGVSAIDLLVCAFIALVVMNILRQEDDEPAPDEGVKNPELFIVETSTDCPLRFCLQIGSKQWWPEKTNGFNVMHLEDRANDHVAHRLIARVSPSAGKLALLVFADPVLDQQDTKWNVRVSYCGRSGPGDMKTVSLESSNGFRLTYPASRQ